MCNLYRTEIAPAEIAALRPAPEDAQSSTGVDGRLLYFSYPGCRRGVVERLLQICEGADIPGGYLAHIADAYIDDSGTHAGSPILCAGGFVFSPGNADKFNVEMGRVFRRFGVDYIRMADLNRRWSEDDTGPYKHLQDENRDKLARIFIRTVKRRKSSGFAATINEADYNRIIKPHPEMGSAMGFLLLQCVFLINHWANTADFRGKIAYFIEHGTRDRGDAEAFLRRRVFTLPEHLEKYRFGGLAHVLKDESPIVSTGDLMAWHWYKYHTRRLAGQSSIRPDTLALIGGQENVADWASYHIDELRAVLQMRRSSVPDPFHPLKPLPWDSRRSS